MLRRDKRKQWQELEEKIAWKIAVDKFGEERAAALQTANSLGWSECMSYTKIVVKVIKRG